MTKLGDLYSNFIRIDLDARGGFARVAEVKTKGQRGMPELCAFKVMRDKQETDEERASVLQHFDNEIELLIKITKDAQAPSAITRIYDSGFVSAELSQNLHDRATPSAGLEIHSTGLDLHEFQHRKKSLYDKEPGKWLPYLVVELAPYDDSLLRQINTQPKDDPDGVFRFATGEVIAMALQLLDVMQYLHTRHGIAYMDWKPEHIYWDILNNRVRLIDWNVTERLEETPGKAQNIRDDIRLFCGAVLYIGLTFVNPDNPTQPIGPRPTKELASPVPEIRRRYWTDNPEFYQRGKALDENIKSIIRRGLDPNRSFDSIEKLKSYLLEYAENEFGIQDAELTLASEPLTPYFKALAEVHQAQKQFLQAQKHLYEAVAAKGTKPEFTRLNTAIKRALGNFPIA